MIQSNLKFLPFKSLFNIWRECYRENINERNKLNQLDDIISKRNTKVSASHGLMIQLTTEEIHYLQNLYEREF